MLTTARCSATPLLRARRPVRTLARSGSFGHVKEPETVHALLRGFWKDT